jgi:hypothetical protein
MREREMSDIFISYSKADEDSARRLTEAFQAQGYSVWWDKKIPHGKTWRQVIGQALEDAKCVVVLWSHESIDSDYVHEEATYAKKRGKLVPVFIDPIDSPLGFGQIEGAQLTGWNGDPSNEEYQQLLVSVGGLLERSAPRPSAPPPLGPKPRPRRRRTWLWTAAGAIVIVAATAASLYVRGLQKEIRTILPKGSLNIDVAPWAEIKSIQSASGEAVEPELFEGQFEDDSLVSPCFIRLPVGTYTIELAHPSYPEKLVRTVTVSADATTMVRGVIPGFHHEDFVPSF